MWRRSWAPLIKSDDPKREPQKMQDRNLKILSVGDSSVGKTQLIMTCTQTSTFNAESKATIGVQFSVKKMRSERGLNVNIQLWDTAGQERFRAMTAAYYRASHGAFVCFDVCNRSTFNSVPGWVEAVQAHAEPNCAIVLVATKMDKIEPQEEGEAVVERAVSKQEAVSLAAKLGMAYMETSSKTGMGLDEALSTMLEHALSVVLANEKTYTPSTDNPFRLKRVMVFKDSPNVGLRGCC